jgi:hypothetical protein
MDSNLFNFDFVNAKTGKVLTKTEKNIQYILNLLISRTVQFFVLSGVVVFFLAILKLFYLILIS